MRTVVATISLSVREGKMATRFWGRDQTDKCGDWLRIRRSCVLCAVTGAREALATASGGSGFS